MKAIITFLACIIFTFSASSQTEKETMLNIDKTISDIKMKTSTFKKVEKVNNREASRFIFFKDKELQYITVRQSEQDFEKNVVWFYVNGNLVYAETIWLDSKTKKVVKNEKQYLDNGHLIAWINPEGKLVDSNSREFKTVDIQLTAYGIKIKDDALR